MKRIARWPLLLIAIPWAVILLLVQTVSSRNGMARGGDPAIGGMRLDGGGMGGAMGGSLASLPAANPYSTIRTVITDLTPDQESKLVMASSTLTRQLDVWQATSQSALQSLTAAAYEAELYRRNLLREDLINDAEIAMVAILNPDQAEKWESSQLNTQLTTRLAPLGLTDAQKAKVTPLIADTAKRLAATKDKDTLVNIKGEFWKQVAGLLTNLQMTQLFAPTFAGRAARGRGSSAVTPTPFTAPATRPN
jgi:hypothetical protein